jgi:hypothetical protein
MNNHIHTALDQNNIDILNNPKKKHPFTIEKTLNELNKERKNKTLINPSYENQFIKHFQKEGPYSKNIH